MRGIVALVAAILVGLGATAARAAENLPIGAFFGTFSGGGVAENRDSVYFAVTARDFDVSIHGEGAGFRIEWTSVIRRGGDPRRPDVRHRKAVKVLLPAKKPGVFRCTDSGNPLDGKEMCWARINGDTLSLYLMMVDDDGVYELQQYDRTLSGSGMKLVFKTWRDGDQLRTVDGRLIKTAN
jgi:hypothetical protein